MKQIVTRLSFALACLTPAALAAQAMPAAPAYKVLRIYRETVKPGKNNAHDALENAWAGAVSAAKPPAPMLAIKAMTGAPENWYITPFQTWADAEKADKASEASATLTGIEQRFSAQEDAYLNDAREMVLTFREDLSYGGDVDLSASRYFSITRVSVRPGHNAEYEANRKLVKAAHESVHAGDKYSMWQAASGAPAGTFFIFVPRKSLAELDQDPVIHGPAYTAALGDSTARARMAANTAAAIISTQTDLFSFAPQQSYPPEEWVKADPGYWKHKAAVKKTP
jgi:hypothetical protein